MLSLWFVLTWLFHVHNILLHLVYGDLKAREPSEPAFSVFDLGDIDPDLSHPLVRLVMVHCFRVEL